MRTGATQNQGDEYLEPRRQGRHSDVPWSWLFPEKLMAGEAARPGAKQLPFQPHVVDAAELGVLHQQFVGTCAQLDFAARRRAYQRANCARSATRRRARRRDDRHRRRAR